MRRAISGLGFAIAFMAVVMMSIPSAEAQRGRPDGFADLAEKLSPSVVNISTRQEVNTLGNLSSELEPFGQKFGRRKASSLGSGFIIGADGVVVTNNHVIEGASEIKVVLSDGREFDAEIRGIDKETDLAVLKMKAAGVRFPTVKFGDSEKARVGEWVVAIGNPFGLGGSVSVGIISARNRNIDSGVYDDYIQTDAAINRGNSGGPLFDLDGNVIGVNTAIFSQTGGSVGVGFSIPSNLVKTVTSQLQEFGETRRGWLGVNIKEINIEEARELGFDRPRGAIISSVNTRSPAANAGLLAGDVIISFNRQEVNSSSELSRAVADATVGSTVPVRIIRNRKQMTLSVKIERRETRTVGSKSIRGGLPNGKKSNLFQSSGLTLQEPTPQLLRIYGLPADTKGAVVTAVDPESGAAGILQPGDVLLEIGWEKVLKAESAIDRLKELVARNSGPVPVQVQRGDLLFQENIRP